jgi:hypothetical protein
MNGVGHTVDLLTDSLNKYVEKIHLGHYFNSHSVHTPVIVVLQIFVLLDPI